MCAVHRAPAEWCTTPLVEVESVERERIQGAALRNLRTVPRSISCLCRALACSLRPRSAEVRTLMQSVRGGESCHGSIGSPAPCSEADKASHGQAGRQSDGRGGGRRSRGGAATASRQGRGAAVIRPLTGLVLHWFERKRGRCHDDVRSQSGFFFRWRFGNRWPGKRTFLVEIFPRHPTGLQDARSIILCTRRVADHVSDRLAWWELDMYTYTYTVHAKSFLFLRWKRAISDDYYRRVLSCSPSQSSVRSLIAGRFSIEKRPIQTRYWIATVGCAGKFCKEDGPHRRMPRKVTVRREDKGQSLPASSGSKNSPLATATLVACVEILVYSTGWFGHDPQRWTSTCVCGL